MDSVNRFTIFQDKPQNAHSVVLCRFMEAEQSVQNLVDLEKIIERAGSVHRMKPPEQPWVHNPVSVTVVKARDPQYTVVRVNRSQAVVAIFSSDRTLEAVSDPMPVPDACKLAQEKNSRKN